MEIRSGLIGVVAEFFACFPQVEAVALSGSRGTGADDASSDFDLYVYVAGEVPVDQRAAWIWSRASRSEIDNRFWEPGDEWIEKEDGAALDVMYRDPRWMEDQIERVLVRHQASVGYSTCFWANLLDSSILFDRKGWLGRLKAAAQCPYPEELRVAIVRKNYPILAANLSSYKHQLEKAAARKDPVALNHRVAAFLASYFDILFAVNRVPHPGEKRLLEIASSRCPLRPADLDLQVSRLVRSVAFPEEMHEAVLNLLEGLDTILKSEGLPAAP